MSNAQELAASVEARIRDFDAAMNSITASIANVSAATEALESTLQLVFLKTMRDEIDATIRELSEPHPEPVA